MVSNNLPEFERSDVWIEFWLFANDQGEAWYAIAFDSEENLVSIVYIGDLEWVKVSLESRKETYIFPWD
jgi:autonomous glycyl radical cofactor GrcA